MKKISTLIVTLFVSLLSTAQSYEQWGVTAEGNDWDTVYNYGEFAEFEFTGMSLGAIGNATLVIYQDGDFGSSDELCEAFDLNSMTFLGQTNNNIFGSDCELDSTAISFSAGNLDIWQSGGTWWLRVGFTNEVDFFCGDNGDQLRVKARLKYDICPAGPPTQPALLVASESSVCPSTLVQLTGTPSGGTYSGTAVTGSTFNPVNLSKGTYTVMYDLEYAPGCFTSDQISIQVQSSPGNQSVLLCEGGYAPAIQPLNSAFAFSNDMNMSTIFAQEAGFSYGPVLNSPDTIYYQLTVGNDLFVLDTAMQTNSYVIDHDNLTGDDRGGIAVTDNYVYVIGDNSIGRFNLDLTGSGVSYAINDGLFSDLRTRTLWSLYNVTNDEVPDSPGSFDIEALAELDEDLNMTGELINLSSTITMGSGGAIFAGYGKLGLYDGFNEDFYVVDLITGDVTNVANLSLNLYGSENWADWGVLSFDGTDYFANYSDWNNQIVAHNLSTDMIVEISSFSDVSDMSSFTYHPGNNRVYFHYEDSGQFGGDSETLGYIDGSATIVVDNNGVLFGCPSMLEYKFNSINLGNDTTICQNQIPLVLEAGFGYQSYTWNGVNNNWNIYPVSQSGMYTVEVVDEANCLVTDQIDVTVDQCLGLDENKLENLLVYPNPNNGEFTIQLPTGAERGYLEVTDLNGRIVYSNTYESYTNELKVELKTVENGIYLVKIGGSFGTAVSQIVVR